MMHANIASEQELSRTADFTEFKTGRIALWPLIARSTAHSHHLAPDGERDRGGGEMAGGATCRRGASAVRAVVDGGGLGLRLGTGGVAGDEL